MASFKETMNAAKVMFKTFNQVKRKYRGIATPKIIDSFRNSAKDCLIVYRSYLKLERKI